MEDNIKKQCSFNFKEVLIDEVALQGLEGIGLDLLWRLMEKRMGAPITEKQKQRYWNFLVKNNELTFYKLPEPVPQIEWLDRYSLISPESGMVAEHVDYLDGPYEYCPIENEYGSCKHFDTRVLICNEDLAVLSYDKVLQEYGNALVIVASLRERWRALAPQASIALLQQITPLHYCILELIGRGRENGQCTVGKSNLLKILKDSKMLFYHRKQLQKLNLIKANSFMQFIDGKGVTTILLRLNKYNKPFLLSLPKDGPFNDLVNYLRKKPNFTESADFVVKMGICDRKLVKRLSKSHPRGTVYVKVEERATVLTNSKSTQKKTNAKERIVQKRFLKLTSPSDESSQSEDEDSGGSLPCKYNVGVSLIRQAYEVFSEAGREGLTQTQLSHLLGIEFYTARSICKILLERNLIRVFFEDKGRQRFKRFILVSKTKDMEDKIELEKQKILEHMETSKNITKAQLTETQDDSEYEVPSKKARIEESNDSKEHKMQDLEKDITEVKVVDGVEPEAAGSLLSSMKSITLRQLKFVNGILTVMQRDRVISGYQPLNNLVAKEINEPPVDTKALKKLVQRLVTDGQLKLMKMKWPGFANRYTFLICAPDIKPNEPKLKAKYKHISCTIMNSSTLRKKDKSYVYSAEDLTQVSYPKYVRIQKLHELITTLVYFSDAETLSDLPPGVCTLVHVIPEFTVAYALGNINHSSVTKIDLSKIDADLHTVKLRETPDFVYKQFLMCSNLQHTTRTNLKTLALLGLIQLIKEPSQTNESARRCFTFYVNRNAKLLDTKGVWPRKANNHENIEKSYYFKSIEDVHGYWKDVYDISTKTTIKVNSRQSVTWLAPLRQLGHVRAHDDGRLLGNGLGPCGFDSGFYLDAPRQWTTYYAKEKTKLAKLPKFTKPRFVAKKKKKKATNCEIKSATENRVSKIMKRRSESGYQRRNSAANVKWTEKEDRILIYCKIALGVMAPVSQPSSMRVNNHIARGILSLNDPRKTGVACYRRAPLVENKYSLEKEYLVNELRCRKNCISEYEDLLRILYLQHAGNLARLMAAARLPVMELVWYILRLAKNKSYKKSVPRIAEDIEEFHKNYDITTIAVGVDKPPFPAIPGNTIATLTEFIMQIVAMNYKTSVTVEGSKKVFELLKRFPEQVLRDALNRLRKRGAIAAVEKLTNNHLNRSGLDDVCQARFRFSVVYQRKWYNRMHSDFMEGLISLLDTDVDRIACRGSMQLNCLTSELHAARALDVAMVTIPVLSTTVPLLHEIHFVCEGDIKYKMKPGTFEIINRTNVTRFSQLDEPYHEAFLSELQKRVVVADTSNNENVALNMNEKIIVHLRNKNEEGSTLRELQENTGYYYTTLNSKLEDLMFKGVVFRVGYYENVFVLKEFLTPWTMEVDGNLYIPKPWLTLDSKVRPNLLMKWASAVLNTVFMCPGMSIAAIAESCEFLVPTAVQDVCELLAKGRCVKMNVMLTKEPDLFSEEDTELVLEEYNRNASVNDIFVFPMLDCITKFANLKRVTQHLCYEAP